VILYLTGCSSENQKVPARKTVFNANYYCEEFSINPPTNRNWRAIVLNELNADNYPRFFPPKSEEENDKESPKLINDLITYCPNYMQLKDSEKKLIWLRVIDAMVYFESSCDINARAKGPNGTAYGLLQLHLGREDDYERHCRTNDSKSSSRSLVCGLNMIYSQIENNDKLFFSGSYWEVLRPTGRSQRAKTIADHIWYYPLCQEKKEKDDPTFKKKDAVPVKRI
jgi:hypothetical protein